MNLDEYNKVKKFSYEEYCNYLQNKYGLINAPYFTKGWSKNPKCTRTKEGLIAHHKFEDHAALLANPDHAKKHPYEWQLPENIVFCDYLEHLFLHILICECPSSNKYTNEIVGIGGIFEFIIPELNDFYSGWQSKSQRKINCLSLVKNDINVYFELIKRIKDNSKIYPFYDDTLFYRSLNERYGGWTSSQNIDLYKKINNL